METPKPPWQKPFFLVSKYCCYSLHLGWIGKMLCCLSKMENHRPEYIYVFTHNFMHYLYYPLIRFGINTLFAIYWTTSVLVLYIAPLLVDWYPSQLVLGKHDRNILRLPKFDHIIIIRSHSANHGWYRFQSFNKHKYYRMCTWTHNGHLSSSNSKW